MQRLLERGELRRGHGRALLQLSDQAARRSLAGCAAAEGWSVRQTEARARGGKGAGKAKRAGAKGEDQRGGARGPGRRGGRAASARCRGSRAQGQGGLRAEILAEDIAELMDSAKRLRR